nr:MULTISPECIES: host attachment protein [unclassified Bradyrhizobium]
MAGIPVNALVFFGDGRKALLLRNEGDDRFPNLKAEAVFEDQNPAAHLQGTDPPGHFVKGIVSSQRGAVEPTDWHDSRSIGSQGGLRGLRRPWSGVEERLCLSSSLHRVLWHSFERHSLPMSDATSLRRFPRI